MQASIAKDYLQKKEELENVEIALTVHDIEALHKNGQHLVKLSSGSNKMK